MPDIFRQLVTELHAAESHAAALFRPAHPSTSAATATATPTKRENLMSLADELHSIATRLEKLDDETLSKLEVIQASPVTTEAFDALASLGGIDPSPVLTAVIGALKALAAPPAEPAPAAM
jgi:hypothetical protein